MVDYCFTPLSTVALMHINTATHHHPIFFSLVCRTIAMEKVILTKSGSLWRWAEKTGYCSTILLSCAETAISYFEPVNCKVELMVHCSIMCNCLYGSHSFVCMSGDDVVYCLCFGLPPQCGERSCRDCYILIGMIWPSVSISTPESESSVKVFPLQKSLGLDIPSFNVPIQN